jgi:hypothetical protein
MFKRKDKTIKTIEDWGTDDLPASEWRRLAILHWKNSSYYVDCIQDLQSQLKEARA